MMRKTLTFTWLGLVLTAALGAAQVSSPAPDLAAALAAGTVETPHLRLKTTARGVAGGARRPRLALRGRHPEADDARVCAGAESLSARVADARTEP